MTRLRQFCALSGLTAVEVLRQPVTLLLFTAALLLMGLSPLLLLHNFGESGKIVRDGALAVHMFLGFMLAGYSACAVMSRDIKTGTASVVLSKPVGRGVFFLAKFGGVAVVVLFFSFCCTAGALLAEKACEKFYFGSRIVGYFPDNTTGMIFLLCPAVSCAVGAMLNLFWKKPFVSSALKVLGILMVAALAACCFVNEQGRLQAFYPLYDFRLLGVSLLIFMGLSVVSAIAMTISVKMHTVQAMSLVGAVFIIGWLSNYFFGGNAGNSVVAAVLYGIFPDWQNFWMGDALSDGGVVARGYILNTALYTGLYLLGVLCAGSALFCDSELK